MVIIALQSMGGAEENKRANNPYLERVWTYNKQQTNLPSYMKCNHQWPINSSAFINHCNYSCTWSRDPASKSHRSKSSMSEGHKIGLILLYPSAFGGSWKEPEGSSFLLARPGLIQHIGAEISTQQLRMATYSRLGSTGENILYTSL
jgi:hypothetical protein